MELVKKLIVPLVLLALVAAVAVTLFRGGDDRKYLTASFPRTVSLYEGSEVRVLGVPVGKVEKVEPAGDTVTVKMYYDAKVDVPADAQAVIIAPSVVGDRFVQLTPVYDGGKKLADGAVLDTDKTSTPLELDQVYASIDDLTVALGPEGRQQRGRAQRPAHHHRQELRRPGRELQQDHPRPRQVHRHAREQQGGALRLRRGARAVRRGAGPQRQDGPQVQQVDRRGLRPPVRRAPGARAVAEEPRHRAR